MNVYDDDASQEIMRQCVELGRGAGTALISAAAERDGAEVKWVGSSYAIARCGGKTVPITGSNCTESVVAAAIVLDKQLTKDLLEKAGVLVPAGREVRSEEAAVAAQAELGVPVVVKPRFGGMGRGITVNISEPDELRAAFLRARKHGRRVLVETYVEGQEYRCHASPDETVAVFRRLLPNVRGDGHSTIAQLVEKKNLLREENPTTRGQAIPLDDVAAQYLARRGLSPDSVVPAGEVLVVRDINGITSGGDSEECLDQASPEMQEAAAAAVAAIPGMSWGGVDILWNPDSRQAVVMEVNTRAAINGSSMPVFGTPRDLPGMVWRRLLANTPESPKDAPVTAESCEVPPTLRQATSSTSEEGPPRREQISLTDLLKQCRALFGHSLARRAPRGVYTAQAEPGAQPQWIAGSHTQGDSEIARRFLSSRAAQRGALEFGGVHTPPAALVRKRSDVEKFRESHSGEDIALLASTPRGSWAAGCVITAEEHTDPEVLQGRRGWFAQVRPQGVRVRVFADTQGVSAVLQAPGQSSVPPESLRRAGEVAVHAVRAMPGLRWACVELVVVTSPDKEEHEVSVLVEGLTYRPTMNLDDSVVAGSLIGLVRMIVKL
ncbi:ATP-binding protein [Nesterenkonia marinintestina]|uniref:ATP-binding protein n=1 Tax=Nesterenkonia marinintestina TaxID=2979865 RepID=UPI0021BEA158|nr:hypothetical protein [Nesterenkonia sp. GX14115]